MSSAPATPPPVAKTPFLAAAAFFLAAAALVLALSIRPLGAAELIGLLACVSAASVFATIPFSLDFARRSPVERSAPAAAAPLIDPAALAEQISAAVESRLAAAEDRRRDELLRAAAAAAAASTAAPSGSRPPLDTDQINAPASTAAKPRLGRGLASLIHNPSALAKPSAPSSEGEDERAAA